MVPKKLLLIDDDQELADLLTDFLSAEGFEVQCCFDGISGLAQTFEQSYDLILLDVMMPGLTGFEVLKALGGKYKTPILMLTAKGDEADKVLGLELGADDYLSKPFNHKELLARINAILRRVDIIKAQKPTANKSAPILTVNQVMVNPATRVVSCLENDIELTGTEFQILALLVTEHGKIVTKETLSEQVLARKLSPFDRSIDMHVCNIRRKLIAVCKTDKIRTIRGAGYLFLSGE